MRKVILLFFLISIIPMIVFPIKNKIKPKFIIMKRFLIIATIFFSCLTTSFAQGDGPRTMQLAPKGIWGLDVKWLNMNQNIAPGGNVFLPNADISVNVVPITLFHTFSLGGRFAQVYGMINPGNAKGTLSNLPVPLPISAREASGTSDGFLGFKLGLINSPALNVAEFAQRTPAFNMAVQFRVWYSGSYDSKKAINLGTNRMTYELGFPMAAPFGKNKKLTWLFESMPSVEIYTANNDPFYVPTTTPVDKTRQKALFVIENHLTKNITPKFWAGMGLRYQGGGELKRDDVPDLDSKLNILGTGIDTGYQVLPILSLKATYGWTLYGYNGANSKMFRLGATFTYVNMKKVKAEMAQKKKV